MTEDKLTEPIDKFEEEILLKIYSISPDSAEKMIRTLGGEEVPRKLVKILRENKISQIIK
jgi:hypothetical protein